MSFSGPLGLKHGQEGTFERSKNEYTRTYVGVSNNPFDTVTSLSRDRFTPQAGQPDPFDPRARVRSVRVVQRDRSTFVWDVIVASTTEFDEDDDIHPLRRPAKITPSSDQFVVTTRKNSRGEWIRNSVGTIVPVEKEDSRWVFDVEKNVSVIPGALMEMNNKINSGAVVISRLPPVPRHKLMVKGIRGEETEEEFRREKVKYVKLFFQLHYRREGWKAKYPNADLYQFVDKKVPARGIRTPDPTSNQILRDPVTGEIVWLSQEKVLERILIDGHEVSEPWPIDRDGRAYPPNFHQSGTEIIELEEDVYEATSFSVLPLR